MVRRTVLALMIAAVGGIFWSGTPHHVFAKPVANSLSQHGYDLWAETYSAGGPTCWNGDASKCTGSSDSYAWVKGQTNNSGPATYVDLYCDTVTVKDGALHADWAELMGPRNDPSLHATLTSLRGGGQVVKAGPTKTTGGSGVIGVSAAGSWTSTHSVTHVPETFTGTGSAVGAFMTGPALHDTSNFHLLGRITSGLVHVTISGTIFHWTRALTSTKYADWKAAPTTQGTMTCDVTPSSTHSDAYAYPGNM